MWLSSLVAGFVAGSLMLAADILATGAVTIGFGGYVRHLLGTPLIGNALGLIAVMGVILYSGVVQSGAIAIVLTVLEAAGLVFVIVIGLPSWSGTDFLAMPNGLAGVSCPAPDPYTVWRPPESSRPASRA